MSTPDAGYQVLRQTEITQLNPDTGRVEQGVSITVKDLQTGTAFDVFVPVSNYGPEQAKTLIEHKLNLIRQVHALGE